MIIGVRRIRSTDKDLQDLADSVSEFSGVVSAKAILDGQLLKDISITVGTQKSINHSLGRELQGWLVVRQSADCNFWDSQASNTIPAKTLLLESAHSSTTDLTITLWVF